MRKYKVAAALCFTAGLAVAFAQTPADETRLTNNPVFKKDCAGCHGKSAEGRHFGGPSLISGKAATSSADELRNIITNGKGRMPKYVSKLTSDEIDTLVQQVRALHHKP